MSHVFYHCAQVVCKPCILCVFLKVVTLEIMMVENVMVRPLLQVEPCLLALSFLVLGLIVEDTLHTGVGIPSLNMFC